MGDIISWLFENVDFGDVPGILAFILSIIVYRRSRKEKAQKVRVALKKDTGSFSPIISVAPDRGCPTDIRPFFDIVLVNNREQDVYIKKCEFRDVLRKRNHEVPIGQIGNRKSKSVNQFVVEKKRDHESRVVPHAFMPSNKRYWTSPV